MKYILYFCRMKQQQFMYVRVPMYIQGWLRFLYAESMDEHAPVYIPRSTDYGWTLYAGAVANPLMGNIGRTLSCSCQIFHLHPDLAIDEVRPSIPSDEYRRFMMPVVLYEERFINGKYIPCDNTVQLSYKTAYRFNEQLREAFFNYLDAYDEDYRRKVKSTHSKYERSQMLDEFMFRHDIDVNEKDALERVHNRWLQNKRLNSVKITED